MDSPAQTCHRSSLVPPDCKDVHADAILTSQIVITSHPGHNIASTKTVLGREQHHELVRLSESVRRKHIRPRKSGLYPLPKTGYSTIAVHLLDHYCRVALRKAYDAMMAEEELAQAQAQAQPQVQEECIMCDDPASDDERDVTPCCGTLPSLMSGARK